MVTEQSHLRPIKIIHIALVASQVMFAIVISVMLDKTIIDLNPDNDIFFIVVPLFAVAAMLASNFVYKKLVENARNQKGILAQVNAWRSAFIVRCALLEAPSLFGLVAFFLSGNLFYLFVSMFLILFFFTIRPTREKLEADLNIRLSN